jgi:hypothetical protein
LLKLRPPCLDSGFDLFARFAKHKVHVVLSFTKTWDDDKAG